MHLCSLLKFNLDILKKLWQLLSFLFSKFLLLLKFIARLLKRFWRFIHSKKRYAIPFYALVLYGLFIFILVKTSGDASYDKVLTNKTINDFTQINPIQVNKIIKPKTIEEMVEAITTTSGPISIGGGKFSMGGQTAYENSLHIDMRGFNKVIELDTILKQVTVQPGIVWRDLQRVIDPHHLSIKIMQTYANFTVGGAVSVNCHGRYIGHGPIVSSVLQIKLVTAEGKIITASRAENQEIFNAAIGGYGGIGVLVEITLQLDTNTKVERHHQLIKAEDYNTFFDANIRNNKEVVFQNGDLYPPDYITINAVWWSKSDKELTDTVHVTPEGESYWLDRQVMEIVSWGDFGKWLRRKAIDPLLFSSEKVTWRNKEASYDVKELEPKSRAEETYVLQEYFIPVKNINSFIPKMRTVFNKHNVNVINVSLRHAYPDKETLLSWAPHEVFAFVIYYLQGTDAKSREGVKQWTVEMTDAILSEGGRWYLPYQPHASIQQFEKGYANSSSYFEIKNRLDSTHRFTNKLLDKYNPYLQTEIAKERNNIKEYFRAEEQTVLTIPEWYLVFNPKEYADYLESGKNPSDFPFHASIDEYWKLYDRSMKLVSKAYPANEEYTTMLNVIGVSITMEYGAKIIYENTIGRFFGWVANGTQSDEEKMIVNAQRAYSDFIYDKAWYEFEFTPWIKKIWNVSNSADSNWLRKWERTLFFTMEFTFKAGYAQLIEWAAKASYEEPVQNIYLITSGNDSIPETNTIKVVSQKNNKKILSITRWGEFTKAMIRLSNSDITIEEIGGNDEIIVSVIAPKDGTMAFVKRELLYKSAVVSRTDKTRLVYLMRVSNLLPFLKEAKRVGIEIEHVYDY